MRLPALFYRRKTNVHKNDFGHVLVITGSPRMLGAAALCSLASMRTGAGLTTAAIPESLNRAMQAKVSSVVMTWPLPETSQHTFHPRAVKILQKAWSKYQAVVIGPGLSDHPQTQTFIRQIIQDCPLPMVIDADALKALVGHLKLLSTPKAVRILTPHAGEMSALTKIPRAEIEKNRQKVSRDFVNAHPCVLVLKGHESIIAAKGRSVFVNSTGNAGMATAGSGDVLAGMMAALLAQGIDGFQSAKLGVYLHGLAGDLAAREKTKVSLIATDIIEKIPQAMKS